jgi:transcriptional regulator with XRE-family HTH domain
MTAPLEIFRERLRQVRDAHGLSQQALAERLEQQGLHLDRVVITKIETGARNVTLNEAFAIAFVLEVPLMTLLFPTDPKAIVDLAPKDADIDAVRARLWVEGHDPLWTDADVYLEAQSPTDELRRVPGLVQLHWSVFLLGRYAVEGDGKGMRDTIARMRRELSRQLEEADQIGTRKAPRKGRH